MSQDARKILAQNVAHLRIKRKLTREELSLALGIDNSYISKLEKGRVNITIDKIEQIAMFFNLDVCDLLKS